LLVVALTEDEFSHLEVQLLSDDGNMFVHHDIQLPEFPLCLAWLDCPPFQTQGEQQAVGNYIAVGSFNPAIEIWNLDVLDPLEPSATLGGEDAELSQQLRRKGRKGKGKSKDRSAAAAAAGPVLKDGSHQDAVMSLSWNRVYRQALASGSADMTVKIWDVTTQKCSHTFTHHTGKVQSVVFHPEEAWRLATGAFDKTVALIDCRSGATTATYRVSADMESMAWDPFQPSHLYASLEDGVVVCIDVRKCEDPLFAFKAHDKTVSSLSFSASVPGYLCTASEDKTIRAWDVAACQAGRSLVPEQVSYKSMQVGKLFALQFFPDNPFLLATGGDSGLVAVWESDEMEEIQKRFGGRVKSRENEYVALAGGGAVAPAAALVGGTSSSAPVEQEDDSWMDEPLSTSSATASNSNKKGKSKSKGKVAKSGR
jgi:periodic tryptophan protein 1